MSCKWLLQNPKYIYILPQDPNDCIQTFVKRVSELDTYK